MEKPHGDRSSPPSLVQNGFPSTLFQGIKHLSCLRVIFQNYNAFCNTSQVVRIMSGHSPSDCQLCFSFFSPKLIPVDQEAFKRCCDLNVHPRLKLGDFSGLCVWSALVLFFFPQMFLPASPEVVDYAERIHLLSSASFKYARRLSCLLIIQISSTRKKKVIDVV